MRLPRFVRLSNVTCNVEIILVNMVLKLDRTNPSRLQKGVGKEYETCDQAVERLCNLEAFLNESNIEKESVLLQMGGTV